MLIVIQREREREDVFTIIIADKTNSFTNFIFFKKNIKFLIASFLVYMVAWRGAHLAAERSEGERSGAKWRGRGLGHATRVITYPST